MMMRPILAVMIAVMMVGLLWASQSVTAQSAQQSADDQPAQPAADSSAPSAEQVIGELLESKRQPIEPTERASRQTPVPEPGSAVELDPAVVGVAPGGPKPKLRREGDFVINRRARVARTVDGARSMLVYEADSAKAPDPPMILLPCQLLESMETIVRQRGDNVVFVVSGQVTIYRGANYLMPTMVKEAGDTENLR